MWPNSQIETIDLKQPWWENLWFFKDNVFMGYFLIFTLNCTFETCKALNGCTDFVSQIDTSKICLKTGPTLGNLQDGWQGNHPVLYPVPQT